MTYDVWADGSCVVTGAKRRKQRPFMLGPGGWAAVVEHGSDGVVLRGREPETTNVRMELRAAIEGLRAVPSYKPVTLHVDCTVMLIVFHRWIYGELDNNKGRDHALWVELADEYARLDPVQIDLLESSDPIHRRAHVIAGAEARALHRGLPSDATPLTQPPARKDRRNWVLHQVNGHTKMSEAFDRAAQDALHARARDQFSGYFAKHHLACEEGACATGCPVWLEYGYSRR